MPRISEITETLDKYFPFETALSYDNVGLLVGRKDREVNKVLVSLDVTSEVIEEAKALGADLILSHHPVIFREIKRVTDDSYTGSLVLSLAENGIAAITIHTNYDRAENGNNDHLAIRLGASRYDLIEDGFATEFDLPEEVPFPLFVESVKRALGESVVRTIGNGLVGKVIAACGAGIDESLILRAKESGAVIVTADVKHNYATMAADLGVRLVEPTHYGSERGFMLDVGAFMKKHFPTIEVQVSKRNINPYE